MYLRTSKSSISAVLLLCLGFSCGLMWGKASTMPKPGGPITRAVGMVGLAPTPTASFARGPIGTRYRRLAQQDAGGPMKCLDMR
jgi:hypothetical protein